MFHLHKTEPSFAMRTYGSTVVASAALCSIHIRNPASQSRNCRELCIFTIPNPEETNRGSGLLASCAYFTTTRKFPISRAFVIAVPRDSSGGRIVNRRQQISTNKRLTVNERMRKHDVIVTPFLPEIGAVTFNRGFGHTVTNGPEGYKDLLTFKACTFTTLNLLDSYDGDLHKEVVCFITVKLNLKLENRLQLNF